LPSGSLTEPARTAPVLAMGGLSLRHHWSARCRAADVADDRTGRLSPSQATTRDHSTCTRRSRSVSDSSVSASRATLPRHRPPRKISAARSARAHCRGLPREKPSSPAGEAEIVVLNRCWELTCRHLSLGRLAKEFAPKPPTPFPRPTLKNVTQSDAGSERTCVIMLSMSLLVTSMQIIEPSHRSSVGYAVVPRELRIWNSKGDGTRFQSGAVRDLQPQASRRSLDMRIRQTPSSTPHPSSANRRRERRRLAIRYMAEIRRLLLAAAAFIGAVGGLLAALLHR
jgi:hypothetical protein